MDKIKILIVDDHQIVREGIRKILADGDDFDIIASLDNGREALGFLHKNEADVVIADLSMPDMSGIELTERIAAAFPDVKVLILSMFTNEDYIFNAIKAGAKGYLPKHDSTADLLIQAVRAVANGDQFYSPSISKIVLNSYVSNAKNSGITDIAKRVQLTHREMEILRLFVEGQTNDEIANDLNISINTVKTHKNNIMLKYNFKSTVEMIKYALRNKLVEW